MRFYKGKLNWFFKREASKAERKPRTPKEEAQPTEAVDEQPAQEAKPAKRGRRSSKKQVEVAKEQAIDIQSIALSDRGIPLMPRTAKAA